MEFKDFFNLMKPVLGKERSYANLVRNLISMITKTDSALDPSQTLTDETLKSYANGKRTISSDFARSIIQEVDLENFLQSVNSNPPEVLEKLANSFKMADPGARPENIASITGEIFLDLLYKAAGEVVSTKPGLRKTPSKFYLLHRYGNLLLVENGGNCPYKGCGKVLYISNNNSAAAYFEVILIDEDEGESTDNLIALCPTCAQMYTLSHSDDDEAELIVTKMSLRDGLNARAALSDFGIETAISEVLDVLCVTNPVSLAPLNYEPKSVHDKIKNDDFLFLRKNITYVTQYYPFIDEQLKSYSREKKLNSEILSMQVKAAYIRTSESTKIQDEIYEKLVEWLMNLTRKRRVPCEIIISYFVQHCEVF